MNLKCEPLMICLINANNQKPTTTFVCSFFDLQFDISQCILLNPTDKTFHIQNQEFLSHRFSHESDLVGDCAPRDLCPAIRFGEFCDNINL